MQDDVNNRSNPLSKMVQDTYGTYDELTGILDLGIEMLFYLEEDTFDRKDIQSVVSAMREIIVILRNAD